MEHTIEIVAGKVINYALQQNRTPLVRSLQVTAGTPLQNAVVEITTSPRLTLPWSAPIEGLPAGETLSLKPEVLADADVLVSLSERIEALLLVRLLQEGAVCAEKSLPVTVLAYDEWQGIGTYPENLAAFVTPNHPEITPLLTRAASLLGVWTGSPSLDAYQSGDANRVLAQAGALYGALQEQNIIYCPAPASFEEQGQRIRLADAVLEKKLGTCMDLTLLYAAGLEAMGLHPLLVLMKGHIFAGVWLEEQCFSETVQDDPALLTKRMAEGIGEIALVECTALTAGSSTDFDTARRAAGDSLRKSEDFILFLDVFRARMSGVRPLPLRVQTSGGWQVLAPLPPQQVTSAPAEMGAAVQVGDNVAELPRKAQWERKLLDLSLRNSLLNLRLTKNTLPLMVAKPGEVEDALAKGEDFTLLPCPSEWKEAGGGDPFQPLPEAGMLPDLITSELKNRRIRAYAGEAELARTVTGLYRTARTSLEENGANTLFLTLGMLEWYQTPSATKPRFAPIILLPVELVRRSAAKGYGLRMRDEEPQMNITLLEMLKQDFGVTVSGLDPLPMDDYGVDIRTVFSVLRRAVMQKPRWDVREGAFLGTFSFSQFVMWNDLRNREADLRRSPIVASLMEGKLSWQPEELEEEGGDPEAGVLLPIPADASQLKAIRAAGEGKSFVLHGPPGTGKSQTITGLITHTLAQGKTVLFVAEKMAALSVVERRLDRIGIGPFCLELHSNKSRKRDVLEQLKAASEVSDTGSATQYEKEAARLADRRHELDGYAKALHGSRPWGKSLYQLIDQYERIPGREDIRFPQEALAAADGERLGTWEQLAEEACAAARETGNVAGHPLRGVEQTRYTQGGREALCRLADGLEDAAYLLEESAAAAAEALGIPVPRAKTEYTALRRNLEALLVLTEDPSAWGDCRPEDLRRELEELAQVRSTADRDGQTLLRNWTGAFLTKDGETLENAWNNAGEKWLLAKAAGQNGILRDLAPLHKGKIHKEDLPGVFTLLKEYNAAARRTGELEAHWTGKLPGCYREAATDWAEYRRTVEDGAQALAQVQRAGLQRFTGNREAAPGWKQALARFSAMEDVLTGGEKEFCRPPEGLPWTESLAKTARCWREHEGELREWTAWNAAAAAARSAGLDALIAGLEQGLSPEGGTEVFRKSLCRALIIRVMDGDENLSGFSGVAFDRKIAQYKKADDALRTLARQEAFCRLAARVPDMTREAAQSSEVGILQRAIRSGGRGMTLRRLFAEIPTLLPRLCPCMLMSPLSAAQYLDPKREPFDLVVFDEASQLPTCKAVGALSRGKAAVIVGDPRQMPPTSFFSANTVDEENLDTEDLESILDDCLALSMPQTHLLWHYRSRHESLIAFSNREFYENRLMTFPSRNALESRVTLEKVTGTYDRGGSHTNRAEAEAVVSELKARYGNPEKKPLSVGVVTFNVQQQGLIEDLFTEACRDDADLEAWAYGGEEPLFIKNLENVQGDERDCILFSVGYGQDEKGKMTMNFGPLNRDGGWRRLNVAVSRARQEMKVFTVLDAEQLDVTRTQARGVEALRDFLAYARDGRLPLNTAVLAENTASGGVAEQLCAGLKQAGYETRTQIGSSAFRVDVGVVDPENPGGFLMGILLDSAAYGQAVTTHDRELSRVSVLEGLGWRIRRVWSVDWWDDSDRELQRVVKALREPQKPEPEAPTPDKASPAPDVPVPPVRIASKAAAKDTRKREYAPAFPEVKPIPPEELTLARHKRDLLSRCSVVIREEAPVTEGLLFARLKDSLGYTRLTPKVTDYFRELLEGAGYKTTWQDTGRVFWREDQEPDSYPFYRVGEGENRREAEELVAKEVANAITEVVSRQIGLSVDDLLRTAAKSLGFARLGANLTEALAEGLRIAVADGSVKVDLQNHATPGK